MAFRPEVYLPEKALKDFETIKLSGQFQDFGYK